MRRAKDTSACRLLRADALALVRLNSKSQTIKTGESKKKLRGQNFSTVRLLCTLLD
jgi:hypothetical protein